MLRCSSSCIIEILLKRVRHAHRLIELPLQRLDFGLQLVGKLLRALQRALVLLALEDQLLHAVVGAPQVLPRLAVAALLRFELRFEVTNPLLELRERLLAALQHEPLRLLEPRLHVLHLYK